MRTICVKVDDDVYDEIEKRRGTDTKSVYYRKIIDTFLKMGEYDIDQQVYEQLKKDYEKLQAVQEVQRARIEDLQKHNGFLVTEFQRLNQINEQLLLSPAPEEKIEWKWWQFWKR